MAVSTHTKNAITGAVASGNGKGARVLNGGDVSGDNKSSALGVVVTCGIGTGPRNLTGDATSNQTHVNLGSDTFAYQPTREFVIRRVSSTLNGQANTTLQSGGVSGSAQRRSIHFKTTQFGAQTTSAYRDGAFTHTGISGQRSNWQSSGHSMVTGGIPDALNSSYYVSSGNIDDAARPTRAAPGEFVIHQGGVGDGTGLHNQQSKATTFTYARSDNSGKKNT